MHSHIFLKFSRFVKNFCNKNNNDFVQNILFTDKTIFNNYKYVNLKNMYY